MRIEISAFNIVLCVVEHQFAKRLDISDARSRDGEAPVIIGLTRVEMLLDCSVSYWRFDRYRFEVRLLVK